MKTNHGLVAGLVTAMGVTGFAMTAQAEVTEIPPSVLVFDQKITQNEVKVDYAYLPAKAYVAVYASDAEGKATGDPIGSANMDAGSHLNFKVAIKNTLKSGERFWVSLYQDKDGTTEFTPNKGDEPIWSKSKLPAANGFTVK